VFCLHSLCHKRTLSVKTIESLIIADHQTIPLDLMFTVCQNNCHKSDERRQ
jgi:hypothetical protein